jgi:hypothetical protein
MKTVEFQLKDVEGVEHTYEVELFSCDENVRFQLMLSTPLINAIVNAVATLAPAFADGASIDDLASAAMKVNWLTAPGVFEPIPAMIEARGGADLIAEIFQNTQRLIPIPNLKKGQPTVTDSAIDSDFRQHLKESDARDQAFGDGNFAEYWQAAAMVVLVNFTRHGRGASINWKQLLSSVTGGLLTPSMMATGTETQKSGGNIDRPQPAS